MKTLKRSRLTVLLSAAVLLTGLHGTAHALVIDAAFSANYSATSLGSIAGPSQQLRRTDD
jgi:hypothetical protein